jgi:hypothetical protein
MGKLLGVREGWAEGIRIQNEVNRIHKSRKKRQGMGTKLREKEEKQKAFAWVWG